MRSILLLLSFLFLTSCSVSSNQKELSSITILDRNGFSETISTPERLQTLNGVNYLSNHPYQSVVRVYKRGETGDVRAIATSYHENGQPKQYLEILNGRANGSYMQWHPNGQLALEAVIVEGEPDLTEPAMHTWKFDGLSKAWNERGELVAEIQYSKGFLDGQTLYYHPNGVVWKELQFDGGNQVGEERIFLANGDLLQTSCYVNGVRNGELKRFWSQDQLAAAEIYVNGKLMSGDYMSKAGNQVAKIRNGDGTRALFAKDSISELHEYKGGVLNGRVEVLSREGRTLQIYHLKEGLKHGEDIEYWETGSKETPKLSLTWVDGEIQGLVTSWYPNGQMESQREVFGNKKQGLLTAWYLDGSLMMIEEYDRDSLERGEYYKRGEKKPISRVEKGSGTVTLYEPSGNFKGKATYRNGRPLLSR